MSGIHFRGTKETSERKTVGNRGLTTRGGGRPRSLLDRGISRLLSQISSQHGRKQLRGISSAAFTPLSRFLVKRLNGTPFVFAATERRSFLASSFRGSFHSRWGEASRIAEKKKKRRRGKKEERGKKKRKGRGEREKKNREGGGGNALTNNSGTWNENPRLSWANLLNYLIVEYLVDRHDVELISISLLPILGRPSQFPDKELGKYCRAELLISSSPFTTSA